MSFDLSFYQQKYRQLLESSPLRVSLIDAPAQNEADLAAAAARTCYSQKGLVRPEEMNASQKSLDQRDKILASTLQAGHLTTRQHSHYVFALENASRSLIWQFLHAHPYYNSEQVSQRYTAVGRNHDWYVLPHSLQTERISAFHEQALSVYQKLATLLQPAAEKLYFSIHAIKARQKEKYRQEVDKKCQEVARYVLPLSTSAYLYHTISALTLQRYCRMMLQGGQEEVIVLVLKMLAAIAAKDPTLLQDMPEPLADQNSAAPGPAEIQKNNQDFDLKLGQKPARLLDYNHNYREILATGYQALGNPADHGQALDQILDSSHNPMLGDVFYPVTLEPQTRLLSQLHFTFMKKLSHTADSQEQRHRTLPGSRPWLYRQMSGEKDYIVPRLLAEVPAALSLYHDFMEKNFALIRQLLAEGLPAQDLAVLLPNAFPVRYLESGELLNFYHKWKLRLCYNAQEEIFYSALEEVKQLAEVMPEVAAYIGPPCLVRKTERPRCPEGERYCGVKVWKLSLQQYRRLI